MKLINKDIIFGLISFILFFAFAIYITYPLIFHMGSLTTGYGDELHITWIQNWVIHSIQTGNILSLFEGNIYFPFHNSLAFSDPFITTSLLAFIPLLVIKESIVTFNFTFISSLILLGFSVYLLSYYLTKNFFASFLSGILIIFSPATLSFYAHIQMIAIEWVPLSILLFLIFIKSKKSKYLGLSLIFFVFQTYNSFQTGYFIIFCYLIITYYKRKEIKFLISKKNILLIIISIVLIVPIVLPYYNVSKEFNYVRDIRDAVHLAIQPEDMLYSSNFSKLVGYLNSLPFNQVSQNGEFKPGYLGFIFSVLVLLTMIYFIKNFKRKNELLNTFVFISLMGFILSLGPVLHLGRQTVHIPFPIPLPYMLFYYVLPGFQGFRGSERWEMLFILGIVISISLVLVKLLEKYSSIKKIIIYCILIAGCILEFNFPIKLYPIQQRIQFPQVYSWLNSTPEESKIIVMPAYNWNMLPNQGIEFWRMYYSTQNFRKMVNGYSGFSPPPWQDLLVNLQSDFPSRKSVNSLKQLGINYIIIDKKDYDNNFKKKFSKIDGQTVVNDLRNNTSLSIVKDFGDFTVFRFTK